MPSMSSRFKMSAATASTSNSHVLCGSTPSSIKELQEKEDNKKYDDYARLNSAKIFFLLTQKFMFR